MTPGQLIKQLLKEKGWKQKDLAYVLQRPAPTICHLCDDSVGITARTATQLQIVLGVDREEWMRMRAQYEIDQIVFDTPELTEIFTREAKVNERKNEPIEKGKE